MVDSTAALELVRGGLAAYNARDMAAALAVLHPDFELRALRSLLDGEPYRGHDGYRQFLADMADEWESWAVEPDEVRELDADRIVVLGNFVAKARASGVAVDIPGAWVAMLRDGLVYRVTAYGDRAQALADLGIDA